MATYNPIAASTFDPEKPVFGSTVGQMNENIDATREEIFKTGTIKIEATIDNGAISSVTSASVDGFSYNLLSVSGGSFQFDPVQNWDLAQTPAISVTAVTIKGSSHAFSSHKLSTPDSTGFGLPIGSIVVLVRVMQTLSTQPIDPSGIYRVFLEIKYDRSGVLPV